MSLVVFPMTQAIYTLVAGFLYWKLFNHTLEMNTVFHKELQRYEHVKANLPFTTQRTVVKI